AAPCTLNFTHRTPTKTGVQGDRSGSAALDSRFRGNDARIGGNMSKALEGVRILDMGHVQAAPTATQLLAWMGADVIKVEMPGRGDITRGQLRDVKGADSLYFTM